jgi:predicted branched-subunit amino acid permease
MALTKSEAKTSRLIFYAAAIVAVLYGLLFRQRGYSNSVTTLVSLLMLAGCVGLGPS